ncbi:hypothetical protein [Zavarzinella formosa]|uniref:hypothetical protein n=1 Tax=Zavarzinella formosa TaxID=360055 RepID=UPI0002F4C31D|nr:hypothetical protein [Zavarzinella formosa]
MTYTQQEAVELGDDIHAKAERLRQQVLRFEAENKHLREVLGIVTSAGWGLYYHERTPAETDAAKQWTEAASEAYLLIPV